MRDELWYKMILTKYKALYIIQLMKWLSIVRTFVDLTLYVLTMSGTVGFLLKYHWLTGIMIGLIVSLLLGIKKFFPILEDQDNLIRTKEILDRTHKHLYKLWKQYKKNKLSENEVAFIFEFLNQFNTEPKYKLKGYLFWHFKRFERQVQSDWSIYLKITHNVDYNEENKN